MLSAKFRRARPSDVLSVVGLLDDADREALRSRFTVVSLDAGERLCRQGRTGSELMFIVDGAAQVVRNGSVVASLSAGDVVGERSVLGLKVFQDADVVALTPVSVAVMSLREFRSSVSARPELRAKLERVAASRS